MMKEVIFHNSAGHSNLTPIGHDGQKATIVRQLEWDTEVDREVGPMYRIRFADGVEVDAFEDELENILDIEKALAESARIDNAYLLGWEDARKYYQRVTMEVWKECRENLSDLLDEFNMNLIETFDLYPEDEMEELRKAALNRGQP